MPSSKHGMLLPRYHPMSVACQGGCTTEEETQFFESALHRQLEDAIGAGCVETSSSAACDRAAEAAKLLHPFRRRFTAAWAWAEALHHAVMRPIGACEGQKVRLAKVRRLQLLL